MNINIDQQNYKTYKFSFIALWTLLIIVLVIVSILQLNKFTREMAINEARTHFRKDQSFRLWGALHGGVYVPITDKSPANPYLSHIPERDIETPSGKKLTLINPAYMVRQMKEMFAEQYGIAGHLTSLTLLRPENAPDEWERKALQSFEKGNKEVMEFTDINGEPHLRLIQPLNVEQGCLKCHGQQGYKVGDVRGGITVSLPMAPFKEQEQSQITLYAISYLIIWIIGVFGISFFAKRILRHILDKNDAYDELNLYKDNLEKLVNIRTAELESANNSLNKQVLEVERANEELKKFSHIVSHDLRNPMSTIMGMSDLLLEKYMETMDDKGQLLLKTIIKNTNMMNELLEGLTELSRIGRQDSKKEIINVAELVEHIFNEDRNIIEEKGAKIIVAPNLPQIYFSKASFYQILANLIGNALKFARDDIPPEINFGCEENDSEYIFHLSDNGIGIDESQYTKIFEMFLRLKEKNVEGSGVGLAIVKKIIEDNNGRVWVVGKKGVGTTFYFTIKKRS